MSKSNTHLITDTLTRLAASKDTIPSAIESFSSLSTAALSAGIMDKRTKEIIALSIAIAVQSPGCIQFHLESLTQQKLSREELLEIIAVCAYMGGGPALMTGLKALETQQNLEQKNQA